MSSSTRASGRISRKIMSSPAACRARRTHPRRRYLADPSPHSVEEFGAQKERVIEKSGRSLPSALKQNAVERFGDTTARFASCGNRPARPMRPQAIEAQTVRPSGDERALQVADSVGFIGVARRTGFELGGT